jgi:hypothetical protein
MNSTQHTLQAVLLTACLTLASATPLAAQTEVMAWGNITGIRVEGQLMEFESSFRVVETGWTLEDFTGKERQPTGYSRNGRTQTVQSSVKQVSFTQVVEDSDPGTALVSLTFRADTSRQVEGVYCAFEFPEEILSGGTVQAGKTAVELAGFSGMSAGETVRRVLVSSGERSLRLDFEQKATVFLRKDPDGRPTLYIRLFDGNLKKGRQGSLRFTIAAGGEIDHAPVEVVVDRKAPGRLFAGLGGNFRLQNPAHDQQVIDYCLNNLRVAFGRVEMPWAAWHPDEHTSPPEEARAGRLNGRVEASMQMARRLAAQGMPVIVSAWFPPEWAVGGHPRPARAGGVAALRPDASKSRAICRSLTSYLLYLKQEYGVEAWAFSFNESDIGIDLLHTPAEHALFIKELGAYMASQGLATKVLLGDNSDATT